jgi:hypothetical protein
MGYADIEARLLSEREFLVSSVCRIAVAGTTGTGKSALINRRFLAEDLLPMDGATAVPTEIRRGPERRMEIFPYLERPESPASPEGKETGVITALSACEGPPAVIDDPTPADVRRHTAAATPEALELMADTTARIRIFLPSPALEGLTLVDTPGIGPMNRAAVTTRYRILPACDRILFTARADARRAAERAFLKSPVLEGRDVYLLPPGAPWANRGGSSRPECPMMDTVRGPATAERAGRVLVHQAGLALARCSAELGAREKNMGECRRIESDISALEAEIRIRQKRVLADLKSDLAALEAHVSDTVGRDIKAAVAAGYAGGMSDMAAPPGVAAQPLARHLESAMADCAKQMMTAVQSLAERYESEGLKLLEPWEALVGRKLAADAALAVRVPFNMRTMDMIALARLNPFGILADILPGIVAPAPCGPARTAHRLRVIHMDMRHRVEGMFRPVAEILPAELDDDVNSRLGAVRQGISAAAGRPADPDRRALLKASLTALERFVRSVSMRHGATGKTPNRSEL